MRTGLGIGLTVTWALVVGAILGPKASISEVTALWLAGVLLALALGIAWMWIAETLADDDFPWQQSNAGYVLAGALFYGLGLVCLAYDAVRASWIGERAGYLKQRAIERWHRSAPMQGDEFHSRVKRLEGQRPRMRF